MVSHIVALSILAGSTVMAAPPASYSKAKSKTYAKSRVPNWGIQIHAGTEDFGNRSLRTGSELSKLTSLEIETDYHLWSAKYFGIIGVGANLGYYRQVPYTGNNPRELTFMGSGGALVRYQAIFMHNQIVVPTVAYGADAFRLRARNGSVANIITHGPRLGIWLFLNTIDQNSADHFYTHSGVRRTYLTLDWAMLRGEKKGYVIDGEAYTLGIRFEI